MTITVTNPYGNPFFSAGIARKRPNDAASPNRPLPGARQPRPLSQSGINLLWYDAILSTQKEAAPNLGRFTGDLVPQFAAFAKHHGVVTGNSVAQSVDVQTATAGAWPATLNGCCNVTDA